MIDSLTNPLRPLNPADWALQKSLGASTENWLLLLAVASLVVESDRSAAEACVLDLNVLAAPDVLGLSARDLDSYVLAPIQSPCALDLSLGLCVLVLCVLVLCVLVLCVRVLCVLVLYVFYLRCKSPSFLELGLVVILFGVGMAGVIYLWHQYRMTRDPKAAAGSCTVQHLENIRVNDELKLVMVQAVMGVAHDQAILDVAGEPGSLEGKNRAAEIVKIHLHETRQVGCA